jgi:DNA repair protein RadC
MKQSYKSYYPITSWAEDDRPREKLRSKGRVTLSNAELLAILIGSGTREISAVDLSKQILAACNHDLNQLGKQSIDQLTHHKGIGEAKAISIVAALELGRRRKAESTQQLDSIQSSKQAFELIQPSISDLPHEEFHVIYLNRANKVIQVKCMSKGGISGTVADVRLILREALVCRASSLILAHNHPSGQLKPSKADVGLTNKFIEACRHVDLSVLDHLIVGDNAYFSFADEGLI